MIHYIWAVTNVRVFFSFIFIENNFKNAPQNNDYEIIKTN